MGCSQKTDIVNWENAVRRSQGQTLRRLPRASVKPSRDYLKIPLLNDYTAAEIRKARDRGTASEAEKMQLERHWFDTEMVDKYSPVNIRASVFNDLIKSRNHQLLVGIEAERNMDTGRTVENAATINPYQELMPDLPAVIDAIRILCRLLGLSSSCDTQATFSDSTLKDNKEALSTQVKDLQQYLDTPSSSAKNAIMALANNIGYILKRFSGVQLKKTLSRPRDGGEQVQFHTYQITVEDTTVQNTLRVVRSRQIAVLFVCLVSVFFLIIFCISNLQISSWKT